MPGAQALVSRAEREACGLSPQNVALSASSPRPVTEMGSRVRSLSALDPEDYSKLSGTRMTETGAQGPAPTETALGTISSLDACNPSSENSNCKQTLKDSQLHVHLQGKITFP